MSNSSKFHLKTQIFYARTFVNTTTRGKGYSRVKFILCYRRASGTHKIEIIIKLNICREDKKESVSKDFSAIQTITIHIPKYFLSYHRLVILLVKHNLYFA